MQKIIIPIFVLFLFSCHDNVKTSPDVFKTGTFKTTLEDSETTSTAFRNDSIQVETYDNKKDTFNIQWLSNFEYVLVKKHPKTLLDSTPFHVKITSIKKNSYNFKAYYKGSNFKQKGTAIKLN
ncbi:hypothetical protein MNBD_BACTEROID02-518 [hydrothermal vent metagenome]|uniref:DNA topoisomerase IV n=1 Tax=hydrothermal vent metagenome TaxID=652676 RepID=A0A3B0R3P3_9ZZZZ